MADDQTCYHTIHCSIRNPLLQQEVQVNLFLFLLFICIFKQENDVKHWRIL